MFILYLQGTFEWVDSVLVRAMERGHWLVLDTANTCSASVLDRLNSVFEEGGRLVVSERGVLGGDIVTVNKHPNFRAFVIYDPLKGEISRAMRNRCVELHVDPDTLTSEDRRQLASCVLGPADISAACGEAAAEVGGRVEGLQNLINQWTLLRHDTLSGGLQPCLTSAAGVPRSLARVLASVLGSVASVSRDHSLFNSLHQLRPVLAVREAAPALLPLAAQLYTSLQSPASAARAHNHVQLLVGEDWAAAVTQFLEQHGRGAAVCDARMLPASARDPGASSGQSNKVWLLLILATQLERLQAEAASTEGSVMSVGGGALGGDTAGWASVRHYPALVPRLLAALKTDLAAGDSEPLEDEAWDRVDRSLDHLRHLLQLGGCRLTRASLDSLASSLTVHWGWVYKHLARPGPCTAAVLEEHNRLVTSSLQVAARSTTKLKRLLGCAPLPPSCEAACLTAVRIKDISQDSLLSVLVHRLNFISMYGRKLKEKFIRFQKDQITIDDLVQEDVELLTEFHRLVDEHHRFVISPENYLLVQLSSLKEALNTLELEKYDHNLMAYRTRLEMVLFSTSSTSSAQKLILHFLEKYDRVGLRLLGSVDYDPVLMKIVSNEDCKQIPPDILHVTKSLVSGNVNIAVADEKFSQINDVKSILSQVRVMDGSVSIMGVHEELRKLLDALITYLKLESSDDPRSQIESLKKVPDLFEGYTRILGEMYDCLSSTKNGNNSTNLNLLLNLLKLQLFCMVGVMDPAEKQVLKRNHVEEDLKGVNDRLKVFAIFKETIGCDHSHPGLLEKRRSHLEQEVRRRSLLTAVRGQGESFNSLSRELAHFARTLGQVSIVLNTFSRIGEAAATERETWTTSVVTFVKSLLSYSTFPDITVPVCEAAIRLASVMEDAASAVSQSQIRDTWTGVDFILQNVTAKYPQPSTSLLDHARWLLSGNVINFFESDKKVLFLKSSLLFFNLENIPERGGDILLRVTDYLLQLWREDEALKEKKAAEAEAMYRTKTLCHEDEDDEVIEAEYRTMFPSFSDAFSDLTEHESLDNKKVKKTESEELNTSIGRSDIDDTVLILVKTLLKSGLHVEKLEEDLLMDRFTATLNVIRKCPGLISSQLETQLIPNLVSIVTTIIKKHADTLGKSYSFYRDSNQEQSGLVRPILTSVTSKMMELLEMFPENPVLLQILKIKSRISSLSITAPIPKFVTGFEILLSACQEWEKNAHKGVTIRTEMDSITNTILSWRKMELSCLKALLDDHLEKVRAQTTSKFWLHVVGIVMEKNKKKEDVVRSLIRFVEAGSIADFRARLDILESVARLCQITKSDSKICAVLLNLHTYYSDLNLGVEKSLKNHNLTADTKMKEFLKIAKWKDTNFWSVQTVMDKTKKALHKILREYEKNISSPCNIFFKEASFDTVPADEDSDKTELVVPLPLRAPTSSTDSVVSSTGKHLGNYIIYLVFVILLNVNFFRHPKQFRY